MTTDFWSRASSGRPGPRSSTAGIFDQATQEWLLDATDRLVRQVGLAKTSMSDVARAAEVAVAMDRQPTLSGQLGEFDR